MCRGNSVLVIVTLILVIRSLPSTIGWNTFQYDPSSITQNEKILKLFLQLATYTASRLTRLRNEVIKDRDCGIHADNNSLFPMTEALMTQSPLQANLEKPIEHPSEIQNRLFFDDAKGYDNDRTLSRSLGQNRSNFQHSSQKLSDQSELSSKASNLLSKSQQGTQNTLPNVGLFDLVTLQGTVLHSNTPNSALNTSGFSSNVRDTQNSTAEGISERFFNPLRPPKSILSAKIVDDFTGNMKRLIPEPPEFPKNVQQFTSGTSQLLHSTDNSTRRNVPITEITRNLDGSVSQHIPWLQNTQNTSDGANDVSQRFLKPFKLQEYILNSQAVNDIPIPNQLLLNTTNIPKSMINSIPENNVQKGNIGSNVNSQYTPESGDPVSNVNNSSVSNDNIRRVAVNESNLTNNELLNQDPVRSRDVLHKTLRNHVRSGEMSGDGLKYQPVPVNTNLDTSQFVDPSYIQYHQTENIEESEVRNKSYNLLSEYPNLKKATKLENQAVNASQGNQETRYNNSSKTADNSETQFNDVQSISALPINRENTSVPLFRSLLDLREYKNNKEKTFNNSRPIQTNRNVDYSFNENLLIKKHPKVNLDWLGEKIGTKRFEKINETKTRYESEQLSPISEKLPQKSRGSKLKSVTVETLTSSVEAKSTSAILSNTENQDKRLGLVIMQELQNSGNINDEKSHPELPGKLQLQDNPIRLKQSESHLYFSEKDKKSQPIEILSELDRYTRLIDDLGQANLYEQLSEAKLQKISDTLMNILRPIIEKEIIDDRDGITDNYVEKRNKRSLSPNIAPNSRQIIYK